MPKHVTKIGAQFGKFGSHRKWHHYDLCLKLGYNKFMTYFAWVARLQHFAPKCGLAPFTPSNSCFMHSLFCNVFVYYLLFCAIILYLFVCTNTFYHVLIHYFIFIIFNTPYCTHNNSFIFFCIFDQFSNIMPILSARLVQGISKIKGVGLGLQQMGN